MNRRTFVSALATVPLALRLPAAGAEGQNWANWRGPHWNGASDETGLPSAISRTDGVKWSTELPGPSAGTPIIFGDLVYITAAELQAEKLWAICLDRVSGAVRWKHDVGSGYKPGGKGTGVALDYRSNYASPSPVADGERAIFFFGNGDLMAFAPDGRKLWSRNMQKDYGDFCFGWTFSSTPQLWEGKLYFQLLQRDRPVDGRGKDGSPSLLLALDPATGQELWRVERQTSARMESREAFSTPIPYIENGRKELLLAGGDILTGHDPATGKELWRWGTWNTNNLNPAYRLVPSPVGGGGVVLGCGPKREPVFAVKAFSSGPAPLAWSSEPRSVVTSDVPTPLYYRGRFYILSDVRKAITCVEPADGKVVWTTPLEGPSMCWASPTGADGKLYLLSLKGDAYVLDAAEGKILSQQPMAEGENDIRSSIAVSRGNLFIRTNSRVYCIGK